ncbi:hypothetical protein [Thiothrix winogradskyi]|uniref:Uncharacterized protein n=1 Tax=Thiothrix winogradskyi TaxID=96472 RepID=A0ABY3SXT7_9GAMM|nr:hypothetical protein [Thiothrix winogradskyi]UJS23250.1 hypothetical protein L2Y54_15020 [Thiothrix winogradskyi]
MKIIYFSIPLLSSIVFISAPVTAEPVPQDAVCQSQVLAPALFRPGTEAVTVYESSTRYNTTPAQMGYGERKVKIADAYVEYEIIPAKFGEVTETKPSKSNANGWKSKHYQPLTAPKPNASKSKLPPSAGIPIARRYWQQTISQRKIAY